MLAMDALSGLQGPVFRHALPQRDPEIGAEAAPADVDGLFPPRIDPSSRPPWPRRAGLRLRRARAGDPLGAGILRHHQIRRVRSGSATRSMRISHWSAACPSIRREQEAIARGLDGFRFFGYSLGWVGMYGQYRPGRSNVWDSFVKIKDELKDHGGARRHRHARPGSRAHGALREDWRRPDHLRPAIRPQQA